MPLTWAGGCDICFYNDSGRGGAWPPGLYLSFSRRRWKDENIPAPGEVSIQPPAPGPCPALPYPGLGDASSFPLTHWDPHLLVRGGERGSP